LIVTAAAVESFVLERYAAALRTRGLDPRLVPDDFNLHSEGIVDSFGVLELIGALEEHFGIELDFEDVDPEILIVPRPLGDYVERKSRKSSAGDTG
jgi:acyl carrier protein